ncbi:MAG: alpha/beta hydrolase-fold protein [Acidobacteriota bacterium]|nr:alpha/beta hydrolase-fold protein [Acidobacteriota bacterium]
MKTACPFFAIAVSLVLLMSAALLAQTPPPDALVSPQVHTDRTVTFGIRAPKASEVTLYGDWMPVGKPEPMTKGPDGVWSVTTPPLEATGHLYWFNLDGVAIADPFNPVIKRRQRTSASLVEVPAASPALWELRDVPHGTIVTEWRKSDVLNRTERVVLYLPPGYERSKTRYPILYLIHGSGDIPESWVEAGHANLILDNLIAEGKAKPMIVVMPAGHAVPFGAKPGSVSNDELFDRYMTTEVMPGMEKKYRVAPGSRKRALAGLSMGGSHTIYTGFHHPGDFSALGIFSPGLFHVDSEMKGAQPALIWISCGDGDTTVQYPRVKAWAESLDKGGIRETFRTYHGAHTWPVWRESLAEFLPLIFDVGK